jgi:hypothetical protein
MEALPEDVVVDVMQYMDIRDMVRLEAAPAGATSVSIAARRSQALTLLLSKRAIPSWLSLPWLAGRELHLSALIIIGQTLLEMRE